MEYIEINTIIQTDLGDIIVKEAKTGVHRCTGCIGLRNAPICHFLSCRADSRKDGKNVIVEPFIK